MPRPADATFRPEKDPTRFCFSPDGDAFLVGAYGGILRATTAARNCGGLGISLEFSAKSDFDQCGAAEAE